MTIGDKIKGGFTRQQLADALIAESHRHGGFTYKPSASEQTESLRVRSMLEAAAAQLIADGEALETEFEKCCRDVCSGCLQNLPVSRVRSGWWHPRTDCAANNIRERRFREIEEKP